MSFNPSSVREYSALKALLNLRNWAFVGQLAVFLFAQMAVADALSWAPFLVVLGVGILSNVLGYLFFRRLEDVAGRVIGALLLLDTGLLAILLYFFGGYTNPFSMMFLVHVTLAAFFLGAAWSWITLGFSAVCYGLLFNWYHPLEALGGHAQHSVSSGGFDLHLHGMLVAFILIGMLVAYFLTKMASELSNYREYRHTQEKLGALATAVAGAAHELGTPLGTAYLISEELKRALVDRDSISVSRADIEELHSELTQVKRVLSEMRSKSPQLQGEVRQRVSVEEIVRAVIQRFDQESQQRIKLSGIETGQAVVTLPLSLAESLHVLLKNALESSPADEVVELGVVMRGGTVEFRVIDRGTGVSPETLPHLGEPFFTTKPLGKGMGLGLFLVKSFAQQVGGEVEFTPMERGFQALLAIPS